MSAVEGDDNDGDVRDPPFGEPPVEPSRPSALPTPGGSLTPITEEPDSATEYLSLDMSSEEDLQEAIIKANEYLSTYGNDFSEDTEVVNEDSADVENEYYPIFSSEEDAIYTRLLEESQPYSNSYHVTAANHRIDRPGDSDILDRPVGESLPSA